MIFDRHLAATRNDDDVLKPTPAYFKSNRKTLEGNNKNDNNNEKEGDGDNYEDRRLGTNMINITIHNDLDSSSSSLSSTMLDDYDDDDDTPLSPPIFPSSNFVYDGDSFGDIGTISHIDALLSVYPKDENLPIVHVVPATPAFEEFSERYGDYDDNQTESLVDNSNHYQ